MDLSMSTDLTKNIDMTMSVTPELGRLIKSPEEWNRSSRQGALFVCFETISLCQTVPYSGKAERGKHLCPIR